MFIFVNRQGNALVTQTDLYVQSSFSLPELDAQANAIIVSTQISPKPAVQVQPSIGGRSYLNVFGEEPLQIQISGLVVGKDCDQIDRANSALGTSVEFFLQHSVVNRVLPLSYTISGQPAKQAFLVGMTITQDSAFADVVKFNMILLSEGIHDLQTQAQVNTAATQAATLRSVSSGSRNTTGLVEGGVSGNATSNLVLSRLVSIPTQGVTSSGELIESQAVELSGTDSA